jgi:hypothetical protein
VPESIAQMDKDSEEEQRKKMLDSLSKADTESLKKALDAIKKNQ